MMTVRHRRPVVIHSLDEIPHFADEEEERAFWDSHEMSPELWRSLPPAPDDMLPPIRKEAAAPKQSGS